MPLPTDPATVIGTAAGVLVAAWGAFVRFSHAGRQRESDDRERDREAQAKGEPIFRNGEAEAIRKALSLIGVASADYRARIAKLELTSDEGGREYLRLDERIGNALTLLGNLQLRYERRLIALEGDSEEIRRENARLAEGFRHGVAILADRVTEVEKRLRSLRDYQA